MLAMGLTSCATVTPNAAGKINGKVISRDEFFSAFRGHYTIFSYQNGRSPDADEKTALFNETWTNITRALILRDYFAKYKLSASLKEVLDTLSLNIPEHIISSSRFQVKGRFDKQLYLQSLTSDRPENLNALRKQYQDFLIPIQKLKAKLVENEMISKEDSRRIAQILTGNADLELHFFNAQKLETIISDSEISAYYQANLNSFRLQPFLKIAYCAVPVLPDEVDLQQAKTVADSIRTQLDLGAKVEELAATNSRALISYLDQGFVKTAEIPRDVALVLENLPDGQSSAPQRSEKGWIIYQKLQSTKTLTLYRSIYIQGLARSSTLSAPETTARRLMNLALNVGLSEAADEFALTAINLEPQHPDSLKMPAADLGKTSKKLRNAPSGAILEPVYSAELSAWVVFEVQENQNRDYIPINEVTNSIRKTLADKIKTNQNLLKAQAWIANPEASLSDSLLVLEKVSYATTYASLPFSRVFYEAVAAHLQKKATPIVEYSDLLIVPILKSWSPGSGKAGQDQIRSAYTAFLHKDWFDKWLDQQVKNANVIKYIKP